jgi:hypothetical protein
MHYRVLILSLTCNIPFFKKLAHVVKETWAKDVIDGKFPDCCWFAYTACDEDHKEPCIDWDDHVIYVDCPDDRNNTFTKIQLTYQALKNAGITYDYILRTNVSTYVNLDLLLPKIYALKENEIIGIPFPWCHCSNVDGTKTFRWPAIAGHCMCYPRDLWEIGMNATNDFDTIPATDDVLISGKINEVIGWDNLRIVNPNPDEYKDLPFYKHNTEVFNRINVNDSKIVNTCSAIIVKQDYETAELRYKNNSEEQYFYELYNAQKNIKTHYKILFLSMSCNHKFFEMGRKVVHDTWAKPIIEGKYKDCCFYSYTTSKTGQTYIKDNCVYVNCDDDLNSTYSKTILALKELQNNGITWDTIVRTNTSVFINVDKTINFIKTHPIAIYSFNCMECAIRGEMMKLPTGWFMILPEIYTDKLIQRFDDLNERTAEVQVAKEWMNGLYDDMLFGLFRKVINDEYNINIPFVEMDDTQIKHYKPFIKNKFIQDPNNDYTAWSYNVIEDPNEINDSICLQVRMPIDDLDYRCYEHEHMYEINEAKMENKHYKILFLSMSCNHPFFEMGRKVVHDTWAKPIIEGKYKDCGFFSYTSSENNQTYIKDNCIYVNCGDKINNTYSKTILALKELQNNGITWDTIVRTNTSTYINVDHAIEYVQTHNKALYSFCCSSYKVRNETVDLPAGWFMIIPKEMSYKLVEQFERLNEYTPEIQYVGSWFSMNDDVLFGVFRKIINDDYNLNIPFEQIDPKYCIHYKPILRNPFIQPKSRDYSGWEWHSVYDPQEINKDNLVFQVRIPIENPDYRYFEHEHMYELDEAKNNPQI